MKNFCIKCNQSITHKEYLFSYNRFGKPLCRHDQPTLEARRLGKKLEALGDWNIEYEYYDGHKSVDISVLNAKVDIEVDGLQHVLTKSQALRDLERTYYSYKDGFVTLHVPNILAEDDTIAYETAKWINKFLKDNYEDVKSSKDSWIIRFFKGFFSD